MQYNARGHCVAWLIIKMRAVAVPLLTIAMLTLACQPAPSATPAASQAAHTARAVGYHEYDVEQRLVLHNAGPGEPEKQNLWVALIRDFPPYQAVSSLTISPATYTLVSDEYGNRYAEFDLSDHPAGTSRIIEIKTRVRVNELSYDVSNCTGDLPHAFTQPELHIESANPQITRLAESLAAGKKSACEKVRAFYDYVGDELTYTYNGENWGAQAALGRMGADCTEYASLLVALSRAQGIPARYFEGLRYLENPSEVGAHVEHAWADVYMPGAGWVGMDPTLGRSPSMREEYFAHYTPDHIIVTMGANPSTLRGASYWTHLYWPGNVTKIDVESAEWTIEPVGG